MTKARKQRLAEARVWYPSQNFTDSSHIVKAYRTRFKVNRECAMRELCMLGMLPAEKQKMYEEQLTEKTRKRAERGNMAKRAQSNPDQDENFYFIAGYTSGGAPYGLTWDEIDDPYELNEAEKNICDNEF